jgi:hypothetical protein
MSALTAEFTALAPFSDWAGMDAAARDQLRTNTTPEQRQKFYNAMTPNIGAVLAHLDAMPLAEHDAAQTMLMRMCLTYAHIAQAIEVQGPDEAKHAINRRRLPILACPADL